MKKVITTLCLILGLISCTQTKYFVKSESELANVNWDKNVRNYIPLQDKYLERSPTLSTTYELLKSEKYSKLKKYLSTIQSQTSNYYLAQSLYHISKSEYKEASGFLRMINEHNYELVTDLLSIDVSYELAKKNGVFNYKKFLKDYQKLIDKYPENEQLKNIVALRTRYIRYNY